MQEGEPAVVWLGGLHVPESYIAALVQAACRARGWPLDKAALHTVARHPPNLQHCIDPLPEGL